MKIHVPSLACCIILLAALSPAKADIVTNYPFPPPGGALFSVTGTSAADAGGVSVAYSGFNPASYGQLYFGLKGIDIGQSPGTLTNLTQLGAFGGATETW